jgi:hypothetical protein
MAGKNIFCLNIFPICTNMVLFENNIKKYYILNNVTNFSNKQNKISKMMIYVASDQNK